jgi:MFS family permease
MDAALYHSMNSVFLLAFSTFVYNEIRHEDPIVDIKLFNNLSFSFANIASALAFLFMAGNNFLSPFYLELFQKVKPQQSGLVFLTFSIFYMLASSLAGKASDKIAPRILSASSMLSSALACLYFAYTLHNHGIAAVIIFFAWVGLSYGIFCPSNNNLIMSVAPVDKKGSTSGIYSLLTRLSLVLGVCLFELMFSCSEPSQEGNIVKNLISDAAIVNSFQNTFLAGAFLCFVGFIFSWLAVVPVTKTVNINQK